MLTNYESFGSVLGNTSLLRLIGFVRKQVATVISAAAFDIDMIGWRGPLVFVKCRINYSCCCAANLVLLFVVSCR